MATTLFTGGPIHTTDPLGTVAEALVVEEDRIAAVGERGILSAYRDAVTVDLGGLTLLPGFIDAHYHLSIAALHPRWADLTGVSDVDALRSALLAQAAAEPDAEWVRGVGWSDLDGGFTPTRADLDTLGLDRPVIVVHYSYHQCVVSSAGLDALGISESTPEPPGGTFGRSSGGSLNGLLVERAFSDAHAVSMASYRDPDRWADHIVEAANALLADGITCVHDAACPPSAERVYGRLAAENRLPISVLTMPHAEALLAALDRPRLEGPVTGEGSEWLRVGPVKLFADGGVLPAIRGRFHGHDLSIGLVFDHLDQEVAEVVARGFRVAVHAIGNGGIDAALGAFEAAARANGDDDHRFRVEHASLLGRGQAARMAGIGAVGVVQPGFVHHMGGAVDGFELEEATWMAFAELVDEGVSIAGSSDSPCAFNEPLLTSARGVTRLTSKGTVIGAEQSVPYEDWLRAYTAGAAHAGGQESERGRLAPGLRADLVVLAGPLDAGDPPGVAETWVAGARVFASDPSPKASAQPR
ncbi:MAG: amidohydrolase [Acidimicrobiales bacterium]